MAKKWTKGDVEQHTLRGHHGPLYPAVNIKVYRSASSVKLPLSLGFTGTCPTDMVEHFTDPGFSHEWVDTTLPDNLKESLWQGACESGFESAELAVCDILNVRSVKLWKTGRSGGWLVVEGLPDVSDWNAPMCARWRAFERFVKAQVNGVPESYLTAAYSCYMEMKMSSEEEATA